MKTKLVIFGGLAILAAGVWYLLFRDQHFTSPVSEDPVGPIHDEDNRQRFAFGRMQTS